MEKYYKYYYRRIKDHDIVGLLEKKGKRYYARTPKIGVLIRNLKLTRNSDFGKERLLPTKAIIIPEGQVFGMKP